MEMIDEDLRLFLFSAIYGFNKILHNFRIFCYDSGFSSKWSISLQMVAASGLIALQMVVASVFAASGVAANCLNLGGPQKQGR